VSRSPAPLRALRAALDTEETLGSGVRQYDRLLGQSLGALQNLGLRVEDDGRIVSIATLPLEIARPRGAGLEIGPEQFVRPV
jgi:hypothetical protein